MLPDCAVAPPPPPLAALAAAAAAAPAVAIVVAGGLKRMLEASVLKGETKRCTVGHVLQL